MDDGPEANSGHRRSRRRALPRAVYSFASRVDNASLRFLDAGAIIVAWVGGYLAGFEGHASTGVPGGALVYVGLPVLTQLVVNQLAGLYGPVWKYASVEEGARVIGAIALGTLLSMIEIGILAVAFDTTMPILTTPAIAAMLMLLGCGGIRFQARLFAIERFQAKDNASVRTLIAGAGAAGVALASELAADPSSDSELVGFVDDDPCLSRRSVRGLRVLGSSDDLDEICRTHGVERVLIALPEASTSTRQAIVDRALRADTQVKVLPRASELMAGPLVRSLRDIDLTDLLGREHAPVDAGEIAHYLEGTTVLVTGAGGSIGSEIARQVAQFKPDKLLLLDRDESLLHDTAVGALSDAVLLLADVRDDARMRAIFGQYRPDVIFHAAAHKHVPLLEHHPVEAVETNLLGAAHIARLAAETGCSRLIHISTDKAACPTSVMGATKRAAELAVFEIGSEHQLPFAAVRFGNVLGSRGSVVPTFLRQIMEGGPVTVTDERMTRYFMTIPEAVSLVLQAGAMADGGKVFLLDMGEPVSILDMAKQMIRLAGLRPGEDIQIEISGSRPGERLHEQLHDDAELLQETAHPSIASVVSVDKTDRETLFFFLELLRDACHEANGPAVVELLEQLLRQSRIECDLEAARTAELPSEEIGDVLASRLAGARSNGRGTGSNRPVLLGGTPVFEPGLPFARPARPPLERVVERLEPSYSAGMLTNGPLVAELQEVARDYLGVQRVVAVSSCTSGLMIALQALCGRSNARVAFPSFTFSATGHAVLWNGCEPRFVDCDPRTFQIDLEDLLERARDADALIATHVFGAPCAPEEIAAVGDQHGIPVLFDAAHAFGATSKGRPLGGFGSAEVFSLTPTKVLVAGEGGLIATNDVSLAETLTIARDYGNPGNYDTQFAGLNARMSEFHAAMALESMAILDRSLARRRSIALLYGQLLDGVPGIGRQLIERHDVSTYKDYTITVDPDAFGLSRDQLEQSLRCDGIDTRRYFSPPVHRQTAYRAYDSPDLPNTDLIASRVLSLPIYPDLTDESVEAVARAIISAHQHAGALRQTIAGGASRVAPAGS